MNIFNRITVGEYQQARKTDYCCDKLSKWRE